MSEVKNEGLEVVAWAAFKGGEVDYDQECVISNCPGDDFEGVTPWRQLCLYSEALAGYAVRDARISTLEFELEVAKTDELSAAVWAATETIKHDLWDAQAEIVKRDARIATQEAQIKALQSGENSWQSGYDEGRRMGAKHCTGTIDQLRAELVALNAKLDASKFCANVADDLRAELAAAKETITRYETTAENCEVLREIVVPDSYKLVPIEPTAAQCFTAAFNLCNEFGDEFVRDNKQFAMAAYRSLVAASPSAKGGE